MNVHLANRDLLERMAAAGFGSVRIDANWYMLQPERQRHEYEVIDHCIESAASFGLEIYATLAYTPSWANGGDGTDTNGSRRNIPPLNPDDWFWFVHRTVARYLGKVQYWGMWNEPNYKQFWTGSPEQYVNLILEPGAQAVKQADPAAKVCGPDIAMERQWWTFSNGWNHWLTKILHLGGKWLDVVTVHNYQDTGAEVIRRIVGPRAPWESLTVREIEARSRYGRGWKPIWLMETGIDSRKVGEDKQAQYYTELFEQMVMENRIERLFWFQHVDEPMTGMGILREDLSPKPAYEVCQRYLGRPTV